jgi:pimeloyl-ACP methyl ester carboxylesterase
MGELGYTLTGDPAVLFLHGFMGSSEDWQDTIATLDGRYRCLAVVPDAGHNVRVEVQGTYLGLLETFLLAP